MASSKEFVSDQPQFPKEEKISSNEQIDMWFLGSLIRDKHLPSLAFRRRATLHNRITQQETQFDERTRINMHIAGSLSEFFPAKWLNEITMSFKNMNANKLGIKTYEGRVTCFLGYIDLYLTFRGLTVLEKTLEEINRSLETEITLTKIRSWKLKLIRLNSDVRDHWVKNRAHNHQIAIISTVIHVMNKEMELPDTPSDDLFRIKSECIRLAKLFVTTEKARCIKKMQVWARALCLKAIRSVNPAVPYPFPHLSDKTQKVLYQKRWQLDQLKMESSNIEGDSNEFQNK